MGPRWLTALGCLCALVTLGHSAAVPDVSTPETMVVTKVDEEVAKTEASTAAEVTTEGPLPPIKVSEMDVRSEITLRYAHTAVVTRVRNPAHRAQEATFRVLLPETAFISGFTMTLDGKSYKAYVKEKEEAKQIYSDAVSHGIGAAHIATKARDSNHFTVSVNVEANSSAVFNLTYEELLSRRNGVYNHAVNLHPGAPVPRLTVTVHIREGLKLAALRVPAIRTGNEIDATEEDAQNSGAVIERGHDDREATITFKPDLEEQRRLIEVYAEKSKESQSHHTSHYYGYRDEPEPQPEGVLGQFVVQYDVARPEAGEVLVNDGYFVHFFAPSSLPPLNKHVVFVLDTSGSMMDRKIEQLRHAMQTILGELNAGDYFSVVEFASSVLVHDLKEADEEPTKPSYNYYNFEYNKPVTLVPPFPATPENVAKAKVIVSRLSANGGTSIASALNVAVDLIYKGVGWKQPATTPAPAPATTDAPAKDSPKAEALTAATSEAPKEVPTQNQTDNKDDAKKLEPIIIFLTDGDPTVGETDTRRIINRLTEKNSGDRRASIFSLAFGEDADRKFLRKLSLRNEGFMRHIYEASDAALQLRDFYRQVASPLLADVSFVYPPGQVKEGSLTKNKFRTVYAGSEIVVAGRVADADSTLAPHVIGICGVRDEDKRTRYEISPAPPTRGSGEYLPLERLWAYLTIKQLLDQRDAVDAADTKDDKEDGPEKKALEIALKYEFVTPLTSLVVVKPNATNAVNAESVDKSDNDYPSAPQYGIPLAAYSYVSMPAAGGAYPQSAYSQVQFEYPLVNADAFQQEDESDSENFDGGLESARRGNSHLLRSHYRRKGTAPSPAVYSYRSFLNGPPVDYIDNGASYHQLSLRRLAGRPGPYPIPASIRVSYPVSTPFAPTSTPLSATTPAADRLGQYHLKDFSWVQELLQPDSDTISVLANNKTTRLELSRDAAAPKDASGDAECARATDGAAGVCVYLTRCAAAARIAAADYGQTVCSVSNKYAGVCCPRDQVDVAAAAEAAAH